MKTEENVFSIATSLHLECAYARPSTSARYTGVDEVTVDSALPFRPIFVAKDTTALLYSLFKTL